MPFCLIIIIFLTISQSGELVLRDLTNLNNWKKIYQDIGALLRLDISDDLRWLAVGNDQGKLMLWDLKKNHPPFILDFDITGSRNEMKFSPDSKYLVYMKSHDLLSAYDLVNKKSSEDFIDIPGWTPVFSSDSSRVAIIQEKEIHIRNLETGEIVQQLQGHDGAIADMFFMQDGYHLVSFGNDRLVRIWNTHTGIPDHVLSGHQSNIWAAAVSPDSRTLFTSDFDGHVKLWQMETGLELFELPLQRQFWRRFSFTGQLTRLLIHNENNQLNVLELDSHKPEKVDWLSGLPEALTKTLPPPID